MKVIVKTRSGVLTYRLDSIKAEELSALSRLVPIEDINVVNEYGQIVPLSIIDQMIVALSDISARQILLHDSKGK